MIKMFESVDDKFRRIGFRKVRDDDYAVTYERINREYEYVHVIEILHKASGRHIVQSYDKDLFDSKLIGNTCVGLSYYEIKLIERKMRQKKWKSI